MPTFNFYYKKEVKAKNITEAVRIEKKVKYKLDNITQDDDKIIDKTPAIGFEYYPE